ncbi:MAG: GspH/FimT family pseudopilin [Gammaproteobacteria bacterium]|jgi:type IV fimbrial biogenesis protein FimT|nr:GspH/FimT family pseudopilin [Gammaproteobacteria bacterium]
MNRKHTGFTLIELMVVLAIASILLTLAVPSFRSTIQNNRIATQANDLVSTLQLARGEAVKRGVRVIVCVSTNQTSCTGTNWAGGWITFADTNANGSVDAGELIKVSGALDGGSTLTSAGFFSATSVQYQPSGFSSAAGTFNLSIPGCTGNEVRVINVVNTGRVGTSRSTCS